MNAVLSVGTTRAHPGVSMVAVCLVLLGPVCLCRAQTMPWVFPGAQWDESKTPEDFGMIRAKLDAFRDTVDANRNGAGVVIKNGYLVYKWGSDTSVIDWASAAKPCIATMLFAAVNEGKVASVDSLILPYWSGLTGKDRNIKFRHLADMTSGWRQAENPGSAWGYNDTAIMLYARTMDKVFGGDGGMTSGSLSALVSAANSRLIVPLQFEQGSLFESSRGHVRASARDYARMGWFWVNRGNWNGTQLLPRSFFDNYMKADVPYQDSSCPRSATANSSGTTDYLGIGTYGGGVNNDYYVHGPYGFNWWFNKLNGSPTLAGYPPASLGYPAAPEDLFLANGLDGQYCMAMIPSLGLVVAAWDGDSGCWGSQAPSFACNLGKITVKSGYLTYPDTNAPMNLSLQLLIQAVPLTAPVITNQPQSLTNVTGTIATFSVGASGTPLPDYQWRFNGANIGGATGASLLLTNIQTTNAGSYRVVVTNAAGAVTSAVAVLTVWAPPSILSLQFLDASFRLTFTGPDGQTYKVLASTNVDGPMANWTVLTNGTFPLSGPVIDNSATNNDARFYRIVSP